MSSGGNAGLGRLATENQELRGTYLHLLEATGFHHITQCLRFNNFLTRFNLHA